nr:uncharacterized protein LOC109749450 [Aegilops tauschii subsp. strangulata]
MPRPRSHARCMRRVRASISSLDPPRDQPALAHLDPALSHEALEAGRGTKLGFRRGEESGDWQAIGGGIDDVVGVAWLICFSRRRDSPERRSSKVPGALSGGAHGVRAGDFLPQVREESAAVDFLESGEPWKKWHDGPTTEFLRRLLGDLRDRVWRLEEDVDALLNEGDSRAAALTDGVIGGNEKIASVSEKCVSREMLLYGIVLFLSGMVLGMILG